MAQTKLKRQTKLCGKSYESGQNIICPKAGQLSIPDSQAIWSIDGFFFIIEASYGLDISATKICYYHLLTSPIALVPTKINMNIKQSSSCLHKHKVKSIACKTMQTLKIYPEELKEDHPVKEMLSDYYRIKFEKSSCM